MQLISRSVMMKFSNINNIVFIAVCSFVFLSCLEQTSKYNSEPINPENTEIDSIFLLKKDSLYAELINKVNNDSIYEPVIRFIINELNPTNTHFNDIPFKESDYFTNERFFEEPLKYLKKMKINNYILVIVHYSYPDGLGYFIIDQNNEVADYVYFSGDRERVGNRKIYDWDNDGNDELVEVREYHGQLFEESTDVVYSVINGSIKLIFSITTREINCLTTDDHGMGRILLRKYKSKGNGIYLISETEGLANCYNESYPKPVKTLVRKEYQMNTQGLLNNFGKKYDR